MCIICIAKNVSVKIKLKGNIYIYSGSCHNWTPEGYKKCPLLELAAYKNVSHQWPRIKWPLLGANCSTINKHWK